MKPIFLLLSFVLIATNQINCQNLQSKIVGKWTVANTIYTIVNKAGTKQTVKTSNDNKMEFLSDGTGTISNPKTEENFKWFVENKKLRIEYDGQIKLYKRWNKAFTISLEEQYDTKSLKLISPDDSITLFN